MRKCPTRKKLSLAQQIVVLEKKVEDLKIDLWMEQANGPFNDELARAFEAALGPHPIYTNGVWVLRADELRKERDALLEHVKKLEPK